jgi:rhodanese-related sulfurtransferase
MSFFQKLFASAPVQDLSKLIKEGAMLVDVRSAGEFAEGSVPGAVNIPEEAIASNINRFKNKSHIIVFCRSGNRSGMAKTILQQKGITEVTNGGTWNNVLSFVK